MPDEDGMESARPQIMVLRVRFLFLPSQAHCMTTAVQLLKMFWLAVSQHNAYGLILSGHMRNLSFPFEYLSKTGQVLICL